MRLTLRTLLAYLDDILEPSQAREIGEKLTESSFASSLVSRIREVLRRRRLTAPTLSGAGVGIDPNTIGEYLDNTLPPDGVADVEKICLESDVHLAEAAACHQILTLALGEPVEIAPQTRERMYALGPAAAKMALPDVNGKAHTAGANGLPELAVGDILSQAESAPTGHPARHAVSTTTVAPAREIPDYLRPKSSLKRIIGYTLALVVVMGWVILMVNNSPLKNQPERAKNGGGKAPLELAAANRDPQVPDEAGDRSPSDPDGNQAEPDDEAAQRDKSTANIAPKTRTDGGSRKVASVDLPAPPESEDEPATGRKRKPVLSGSKKESDSEPSVADKVAAAEKTNESEGNSPSPSGGLPPPSKYLSPESVLLNYVARDERWFMIPPRALVHAGDNLAVPDPYQCGLEVDGGKGLITIVASRGRGTVVRVLEPTEAGAFGLELKRGQFIARPAGVADSSAVPLRIGVGIAGELWRLEVQPNTICGVQVNPMEPTKFEQVLDKNAYDGGFYVASGVAIVTDPAGGVHEIKGADWLELPLLSDKRRLEIVPKWLVPQTASVTDLNRAKKFASKFSLDDAVELSIPEVAADPNPEISRLATECLALIEAYGPLVDILHRSQHEEARRAAITGLRVWLPRNPANKELLKAELAKRFPPDDADVVYRLLWGYDDNDARTKQVSQQLIEWMANEEISIRELAFYHVFRLTGKTHDYRPNSQFQLKSGLKHWQEHLKKDGTLLPAQKPVPNPQ